MGVGRRLVFVRRVQTSSAESARARRTRILGAREAATRAADAPTSGSDVEKGTCGCSGGAPRWQAWQVVAVCTSAGAAARDSLALTLMEIKPISN